MIGELRRFLGIDGAVAYTLLARATNIVGSIGTVLLIVHFLNPVEQGYYYTLLSLVSLQLVFELGFSFVIQQLAAHECIHLELHSDGTVSGDAVAHARLATALQLSVRWFTAAAVAMAAILSPLGMVFFARHATAGSAQVAWQGPWLIAVAASAISLWCMPFYSFLEGCGHIRAVAAMRFRQAIATGACAWLLLLLHRGLYAPAAAIIGFTSTGLFFVFTHRRLLANLLRHRSCESSIHWVHEVWPFQWRIAVSWTCSYFTVQIFIPILFAFRSPVEAGQMGMSLSIAGYISVLALAWISTKGTPFGAMIARRQFAELERIFRRTLLQSLAVFSVIVVGVCAAIALLAETAPHLAARVLAPRLFVLLILAAGANCIVQSLATLLRCFKTEPFLNQSLIVAATTLALCLLTARQWGNTGATLSYLVANGLVGLPIAVAVFLRARKSYLSPGAFVRRSQPCKEVYLQEEI